MAEMLIQSESLTSIADEIRVLSGTEDAMSLDLMESHIGEANLDIMTQNDLIEQIKTELVGKVVGIIPSGTKSITENGEHDVTEYESVNVDVPIPDEYIIPEGTLDITENGEHDVTTYSSVLVDVQSLPIGISKLSVCSFVPSSANETIKITHGLGEKPNFDIIFRNTKVIASGRSIVCMLSINIPVTTAGTAPSRGIKWITSDAPDNNYLWDCAASKTSYQGNATTISRTTSAGANSSSWEVGQTYYCVAGVLDAL